MTIRGGCAPRTTSWAHVGKSLQGPLPDQWRELFAKQAEFEASVLTRGGWYKVEVRALKDGKWSAR